MPTLVLAYSSPDGDQGIPGALAVQAAYRIEECWLWLTFEARTSQPTLVSLSAHPYFNLAGPDSGCVLDHVVTLPADRFLPTDVRQIPTGEIRPVEGRHARDIKVRPGMMASLSGDLATMGPGVPYAIAAKFAFPERVAVAMVGDGAMQMNGLNGLITISKYWRTWAYWVGLPI